MHQSALKSVTFIVTTLFLAATALVACAPPAQPTAPEPKTTGAASPAAVKAGWEAKWDSTLAAAKKEGTVVVYTLLPPEARIAAGQAFKDKYGITVEFSAFSRGPELLAKVQAEKRAGLNLVDIFSAGPPTLIATMKPEGVLGSMEPYLILPEVTNPKNWRGDRVPFMDNDKTALGMVASLQRNIMYNTELIKQGELTGYEDLLKPQYKGKITINDPSVAGVGNAFFSHLAQNVWDVERTSQYIRQLIKDQEAVIQRDNRLHIETVARGKYAIGLAPIIEIAAEFLQAGAPLGFVVNKEGVFVSPATGAISVSVNPAHPNATTIFINWLLSIEGQTVFSKNHGNPSLRVDVPTDSFFPIFLPQPGEKIYLDAEDSIIFRGKMLDVAKKVIEDAQR